MVFAKTRMEPPVAVKQSNQYMKDLQRSRNVLLAAGTIIQKDSVLEITLDRLLTFSNEGRIKSDEADNETDELLNAYIPFFVKDSYGKFSKNVWYESDHKRMLDVIAGLRKVTHADKKAALNKSQDDSLSQIQKTISDYRQAKVVSRRTTYNGIENARTCINQARQYANDHWLSNCISLVTALRNVKPSIAKSHYRYVAAKVEELSQYRYYSKEFYSYTLVPNVDRTISEYDREASKLYGSKQDVNTLRNKARNYVEAAENYYDD